jgi:surface polysaccharide O-acyltransferase-like enzyme
MNPSIDLIRVVAVFLIVLNHASSWCQLYNANWNIYNFYQSIVSIGVPLFIILSGRLLLDKDEPIKSFFKKRLNKIMIPFIGWSYIYLFYQKYVSLLPWQRTIPFDAISFSPIVILQGPTYAHLWFIYTLLSLYLAIPIFRKLCAHIPNSYLYYLLLLWFAYSTQSIAGRIFGVNATLISLSFITVPYMGFLFVGYLLSKESVVECFNKKISLCLWFICTVSTIFLNNWYNKHIGAITKTFLLTISKMFWLPDSPFVIIASLALFGFMQRTLIPNKIQPIIRSISNASFGIFFCHMIFLYLITIAPINLYVVLQSLISIPVVASLCFMLSYMLTICLKRIPFVRHIV